jgi:hypothetical protein
MENQMSRSACWALCLLCLVPAAARPDQFVPDDQVVSDPSSDLPTPEFDRKTKRLIWADRDDNLWVGNVDLVSGALSPMDGKGTLVDTNISPPGEILNTPRYTYGAGESAIVYNRTINGKYHLAKAVETAPDVWDTSVLVDGADRWKPNGSPEETTDPARIVYNHLLDNGETVTSWRTLDDPDTEQTISGVQGGRFFGSEEAVVVMNEDAHGVFQIYLVPFSTGVPEQVSFGTESNFNAFIWYAPEYQEYLIVAMINFSTLAIYRQVDGAWQRIYRFHIPTLKLKLSSPEGFVANGKSYIAVISCDELGSGGFVGQPVGPSEVWVAGIDKDHPFFRRIDDTSYEAQRAEPEPFLLDHGPVVYYSEVSTHEIQLLKRAATGLSGVTGYDIAHYGGSWSTTYRDNKNCACTPYQIADQYESAYDVPMSNTQFVHPTLGPEDQLYFGILARTDTGSTTQMVAVDTRTGTEAYRIPEESANSKLATTDPLVDLNGNYYVAANDAFSKYNSQGQREWRLPTNGLARSAQFTSDGNILFFTWNGWAYVISPDGEPLLARNLTPGRSYPANPSCLGSGAVTSECAYVGPPAVDAYTDRVYVTQMGTGGNSALQAFQYVNTPAVDLKKIWNPQVVLAGLATSPVLSADYTRVYLQDGAGNLNAYDAVTGARIWKFPLGFRSDTPPVVNANGYIMPGGSVDRDAAYNFIALVKDLGARANWAVQDSDYVPKSFAAAGAGNRFVLAAREGSSGSVKLLVVQPSGVLSASPWGAGTVPGTIKGLTLRNDGWVFLQTSGTLSVKAFAPAP